MCSGAIINSRISTLIFGAYDDEKGCVVGLFIRYAEIVD